MNELTLITGASSGIGKELAKIFSNHEHHLVLVARREKELNELADELRIKQKIKIYTYPCDITKENELENLYIYLKSENLKVTNLINNAGVGDFNLFENSDKEKNNSLIDLNIKAVLNLSRYFIPEMLQEQTGRILNIASMAAFMPSPYIAVYAAAKSFILNYSIALNSELEEKNIQVSVLCPGDIKTEFQKNANLEKFEVNSNITLSELANFTYQKFINDRETLIIPSDTKKHIEMMTKSGSPKVISRNLYKMRKLLARKLGV